MARKTLRDLLPAHLFEDPRKYVVVLPSGEHTPATDKATAEAAAEYYSGEVMFAPKETPSDGCTKFPDGKWRHCCVEHDRVFLKPYTKEDLAEANAELRRCVMRSPGCVFCIVIGWIMWFGVTAGNIPWARRLWTKDPGLLVDDEQNS